LYHTEVRWLNCGTKLKCVSALRLETEMFINDKGKVVAELSDEKWLWNVELLCDMSHYFKITETHF